MADPHNCQAVDDAAELGRQRAAAADQHRRQALGAAYERGRADGVDEGLDKAVDIVRDARDGAEAVRLLLRELSQLRGVTTQPQPGEHT